MSGNTRAWTWETHELSEGMSSIVYDEHGMMLADHLDERTAALIASAPAMHAALESVEWLIVNLGDSPLSLASRLAEGLPAIETALALSHPLEEKS